MSQHPDEPTPERAWPTGALIMLSGLVLIGAAWLLLPEGSARGQGSESAAVGALEAIANAQLLFREGDKDRDGIRAYTGSLQQLGSAGPNREALIDPVLAAGVKQGYHFSMGTGRDHRFEFWVKACPTIPGQTGDRYFATDMSRRIYWSDRDFPISDVFGRDLPDGVFVLGN
jgi:hypothetical protein